MRLDRTTFRRLVQLNWLFLLLVIPIALWQVMSQGWNDFDTAFELLLRDTYGYAEQPDWMEWTFGALIVVHIAGTIGVYWFQNWARHALWLPILIVAVLDTTVGQAAMYEPTLQVWWGTFSDAVFGAVVLASYCHPISTEFSNKRLSGEPV